MATASSEIRLRKRSALSVCASSLVLSSLVLSSQAAAYEDVGKVADGGTVAGQVFFRGTVPKQKIVTNKDLEICGASREEPVVDVGANQGVANAIVYLTDVAKGKAWPPAGAKPQLNNVKCRFEPAVQVIQGGSIDVVNKDPVLHNTHGYYGKRTAFNVALPNQNQSVAADLQKSGTVRIDCDAHGWMEGWVFVRDNPYYALTDAEGKFTIGDIPPGTYTLVTEQPYSAIVTQSVAVAAKAAANVTVELKLK